jgi:hypothetical protein
MGPYQMLACGTATAIFAALTIASTPAAGQDSKKPAIPNSNVEHCKGIKDERAQKRCNEQENSSVSPTLSERQSIEAETWQLARTPNPAGGPDSISITKITDAAGSDHDIAGLMLRCGEGATTEVLVVLVEALPARTHPKVTVVAGRTTTEFTGSIVTPGALVLLPEKASALVENAWQSVPELGVAIADNHRSLHGIIPLTDIGIAMQTLQSNCPKEPHSR